MTRTAFSYLRFSSGKQSKGDSSRRQTELMEGLIERKGWTMDTTLNLKDLGVSGWKGKNAAIGALAEFLNLGERQVIVYPRLGGWGWMVMSYLGRVAERCGRAE